MRPEKKSTKVTRKNVKPDIEKPGQSAPSGTSIPVIVTNRPVIQDPMVAGALAAGSDLEPKEQGGLEHNSGPKLQPSAEAIEAAENERPEEAEKEDEASKISESPAVGDEPQPAKKEDEEASEKAKREAEVEQLVESRRYELPINAVEKRKAKHFVVIGVVLAVLLALLWADIALDAGLINIDGVKPVTHFFSN